MLPIRCGKCDVKFDRTRKQERICSSCKRARNVMRSKPALEFAQRDRELGRLAAEAPRTISYDSQGRPGSVAGSFEALRRQHREAHSYPPGLLEALDQHLLGRRPADPAMAAITGAIIAETA